MSNDGKENGKPPGGGEVHAERVAVVTLTLSLERFTLEVGGVCPNTELAKAICLMGADAVERQIQPVRALQAIEIAGPDISAIVGAARRGS